MFSRRPDLLWFYDTEFIDTAKNTRFISIAIVPGEGMDIAPYVGIDVDAPWDEIIANKWLHENVWVHLPRKTVAGIETIDNDHPDVKTKHEIKRDLEKLFQYYTTQVGRNSLWGYFSSYDHLMLSRMWGRMLDLPDYVPMWTNDVMQLWERHNYYPPLKPVKPKNAHDALADAEWTREFYYTIMACNGQCGSHVGRML